MMRRTPVLCFAASGPRFDDRLPLPASLSVEQLEAHVQCQLSGRVRNFQVHLEGEALVLRGQARTYYAKQLAQHAVMDATHLPIRANEIEVT
jgi:hypothetical protein